MKKQIFVYNTSDMRIISKLSLKIIMMIILIIIGVGIGVGWFVGKQQNKQDIIYSLTAEDKLLIINDSYSFSEEEFVKLVLKLNIKHPEMVIAQSLLETNHFKSKIFKENNNCFGMREAVSRSNTAVGTQYNHALYDNWKESVIDYALWQEAYARKTKTGGEYIRAIASTYAEATHYIEAVEKLIPEAKQLIEKYK